MRRLGLLVLAAGPWWVSCRGPSAPGSGDRGYWTVSCLSGDGRHLIAGGDHAALVDPSSGTVVLRLPGMVKTVGCDRSGAVVVGYGTAVRLPGRTSEPVPSLGGDTVLARSPEGAWISAARSIVAGKWRGPATVFVTQGANGSRTDLVPERFGSVGSARSLPFADSFAVRFGNLLQDGRLLLAAGWQPSRSGGTVEEMPWGFFAWDLKAGEASPLTAPLPGDTAINQAWVQKIAATGDGAHLVVAVHDGERLSVGWFERGANRPTRVVSLASKGAASAVSLSEDGAFVAVGSESRGREAPAQAWLLDAAGKVAWSSTFDKTIAGVHFLSDRSLVVAAGEARAVRVALPH